jgi:glutathione S-transferase
MPNLKLYYFPGTCARVALIALEECQARFETQLIKLVTGEHRTSEFLAINPLGKVPTLTVDGQPLTEVLAIIGYLQRLYPQVALMPPLGEPLADARNYAELSWMASSVQPIVTRIMLPQLFCDSPEGAARVSELGSEMMRWHLRVAEQRLANQPWLLGSQWTMVDAYLFWMVDQINAAGFDAAAFPNISAHGARSLLRPAIQRAMEHEKRAGMELAKLGLPAGPPPRTGKK